MYSVLARILACLFLVLLASVCLAQQISSYNAVAVNGRYEITVDLSSFDSSSRYDVFLFARRDRSSNWEKLRALGGGYLIAAGGSSILILWEPILELKEMRDYEFNAFAFNRSMTSGLLEPYLYDAVDSFGFLSLSSNTPNTSYTIGDHTESYTERTRLALPTGIWRITGQPRSDFNSQQQEVTINAWQSSRLAFNWQIAQSSSFQRRRDDFAGYVSGGLIFPFNGRIYANLPPEISDLKSLSVCALKATFSGFGAQTRQRPSLYLGVGVADNVSLLQGVYKDERINAYNLDLLSLHTGLMIPVFRYGAFLNLGGRAALNMQRAIFEERLLNSVRYSYITGFYDDEGSRKTTGSDKLNFAGEASAQLGIKLGKSWYVSLSAGARYSKVTYGQWYKKDQVLDWENYNLTNTPAPVTNSNLPIENYFLDGVNYFINVNLSPFF